MSRSAAKNTFWLAHQISTAQRNLSEWPSWMKEAAKFQRSRTLEKPLSGGTLVAHRTRKAK